MGVSYLRTFLVYSFDYLAHLTHNHHAFSPDFKKICNCQTPIPGQIWELTLLSRGNNNNNKIPNFRAPERPTSVHEHHMYEKSTTHVNRTYSQKYWFIYIDSCTDILYYYTQVVLMNCVHNSYIYGIHTHGHCTLYI
jgi:hypothetical protein